MFTGKVSFLKKNGALYARAVYRDPDPKQVWRKVKTTKAEAKAEVIQEIEGRLKPKPKHEHTFKDLCSYYKEHHCIEAVFDGDVKIAGKKSYKVMLFDVAELEAFFGDKKLREMTRDDIQRYRIKALSKTVRRLDDDGEEYLKKRSLSTVNHHLRTLRSMLGVAYEQLWIDRIPPFSNLISPASEGRREVIPTDDEFKRILNACDGPKAYYMKAVVLMIADTGARPIEMWHLKWSDIQDAFVTLTSDKGKKRTRRTRGMTTRLRTELDKLPKYNEMVFGGIKSVKNAWKRVQKKAGVKTQLYDLRHYHASKLKELGYDSMDIMKAMGHTRLATTDRYVKVSMEREREMAERIQTHRETP
jgi:integrase